MTITVQQVVDRVLSRHWSFVNANEGSAVAFLDQRQRSFLLDVAKTVEAIIGTTTEILTALDGTFLVAVDDNGVPYFVDTESPGYAIRFDGGVPYIEITTPIIVDPFGSTGDAPGLPLPDDILRLISVCAMTETATIVPLPIEVLNQEIVRRSTPRTGLQAFLSANRLIPIRTSEGDLWSEVTSIRISAIICPTLSSMADVMTVPSAILNALESELAKFFAGQAKGCPQGDKKQFAIDAQADYEKMFQSVNAMDAVTTSTVILRR